MKRRMPLHRAAARPAATAANPVAIALRYARRLTPAARAEIQAPLTDARNALFAGVGNLQDWQRLAGAMNVAQAIERQGVVRGLAGHIRAAELALQALHQRAADARYPIPDLGEIDAIDTALALHAYQLAQLSHGEYLRAWQMAADEVRSTGGQVLTESTSAPLPA